MNLDAGGYYRSFLIPAVLLIASLVQIWLDRRKKD